MDEGWQFILDAQSDRFTMAPNDLWTADFKGPFRTGNGVYCYPLTIADQYTRFLLTCHGLLSTQTVTAKPLFERAFREDGLPNAIRTDNGVPFATQAIHGLSYLNVSWLRLGIQLTGVVALNAHSTRAHASHIATYNERELIVRG